MAEKKKWNKIGSVLLKKDGEGTYIKISKDVILKEGTIIQVQDPRAQIDVLLARGLINEQKVEERKRAIRDFVKFDLVIPPPKD